MKHSLEEKTNKKHDTYSSHQRDRSWGVTTSVSTVKQIEEEIWMREAETKNVRPTSPAKVKER